MARTRAGVKSQQHYTDDNTSGRTLRKQARVDYTDQLDLEVEVKGKRPSRILNTNALLRKPKAKTTDLQATNWPTCPLLDLPGELRNRIFEYALGGCTMHIWTEGRDEVGEYVLHRKTCCRGFSPKEGAQCIKKEDEGDPWESYHSTHQDCDNTTQAGPAFALLQMCRQVHAETALLPFALNTFAFDDTEEVEFFIKRLIPKQGRAVQHISIRLAWTEDRDADSEDQEYQKEALRRQKLFKRKLLSLQSLTLLAEFENEIRFLNGEHESRAQAAMVFGMLDLERVTVAVYNSEEANDLLDDDHLIHGNLLRDWEDGLEAELKKDWAIIVKEAEAERKGKRK
ncbi:Hypothetical predicted protein [Lecanosticta acicola]|uniref:DUF7730 domain-containing protein n=1 Tax=Lecanosticta acicola TaxID=111012 RepID=A0AAI8YY02_9PEZI|nr:Hypothetical predicted protein [Lecanosticta acicola]